jgi:hypothetical protein
MNRVTLSLITMVWLGSLCVAFVGCVKHSDPDPTRILYDKVSAAFGVPWESGQFERKIEKRFGLGSPKADVIKALALIAASRDDCELIQGVEGIEGNLHYVSFVFHYEHSPSDLIVWRFTVDFGFDAQEKLVRVLGGTMSIPRAEAPPWHPGIQR